MQLDLLYKFGNRLVKKTLDEYYRAYGYRAQLTVVKREKEERVNDLTTVFGNSTTQFSFTEFSETVDIYLLLGRDELAFLGNRSSINVPIYSSHPILKGSKITVKIGSQTIIFRVDADPEVAPHNVYYCTLGPFTNYQDSGGQNV